MLEVINGQESRAVQIRVISTGTDRIQFKLKVERETGKSFLTKPVPEYGLQGKSTSEYKSGLIAWDKETKSRKFGIVHEWRILDVEYEPVVRKGAKRGPKPKKLQLDTPPPVVEVKAVETKSPETHAERCRRRERMNLKLEALSVGV